MPLSLTTVEEPIATTTSSGAREPIIIFVELDQTPKVKIFKSVPTPPEQSANTSTISDVVTGITKLADGESTRSVPFAALSQIVFISLAKSMHKTLPLQLHLVLHTGKGKL